MTPDAFRVIFPEFAAAAYPDATVAYWLGIAARLVSAERWAELADHGVALVTAHYLAMSRPAGAGSGAPGQATGVVTAKTIDKVSVSYDVAIGSVDGAGQWNATSYGRQYADLAQMMGSGGLQF